MRGLFHTAPVFGTTDWQRYSKTFHIPEGIATIRVGVFLSLPGTALFDDIILEKMEPPVIPAEWGRPERWQSWPQSLQT